MAYRQAPSPRFLARTSYIPENDPNRPAAQQEVMDAWDAQFGPKAQWDRNYQFVLQNTGDPEKARIYADSIASTQKRQELTQLATGVAGPATSFGREAIATARALRAAPKVAEEAPGAVRLLAGPSSRNAQTAEEMLTPNVIYGTSAEGAPRLTYARPETRYRMAVDRPAGGKPLANYEEPVWDQMYDPTDLYARQGNRLRPMSDPSTWGRGQVVTRPDPLDILAAEGGPSTEAVELAQKLSRGKAQSRAAQIADEEARFAGGEGPNYAEDVLNRRRLAAEENARAAERETRFQSNQLDTMAGEGGGAARQAEINDMNRRAKADFEARQLSTWDDEAGAITSGRNPPQPVSRALQVVERQTPVAAPASGPGTGFTMVDTPGQGFTMVNPPSRAVAMRTVGSEAAPTVAPQEWFSEATNIAGNAGKTPIPFNKMLLGGLGVAGFGAGYGAKRAYDAASQPAEAPRAIDPEIKTREGRPVYFTGPSYDINSKNKYDYMSGTTPSEVLGSRRATASALDSANIPMPTNGSGRGAAPPSMADYLKNRADAMEANAALDSARMSTASNQARAYEALNQPRRPQETGLSNLFKDPYAGMSARDMFVKAQELQRTGDESGANILNIRASRMPDVGQDSGMKRGGAAKSGKDEAVHKALDIISHLLMHR
jgi:hypothetical protein